MKFNASLFAELSIRGRVGTDITPEFAFEIGRSFGRFLRENGFASGRAPRPVVVVRDNRPSSPSLSEQLILGLMQSGLDVLDGGICPTPVLNLALNTLEAAGGVAITGSHNSVDTNGFKLFKGKLNLNTSDMREILDNAHSSHETKSGSATRRDAPLLKHYLDVVSSNFAPIANGLRVVIDAGNGTAGLLAPELFKRAGAKVIPLFCELDGTFPHHHPDPSIDRNLVHLQQAVVEQNAAFGVAYDADADRLRLVDEAGVALSSDELASLFTSDVLRHRPQSDIVLDVKMSDWLHEEIHARGGTTEICKTGAPHVRSMMTERASSFGAEDSGHFYFADTFYGFDDAIYASLRAHQILAKQNEPLSKVISARPKTFRTPFNKIPLEPRQSELLLERVRNLMDGLFEISTVDGLRFKDQRGWGILRASKTEPILGWKIESRTADGFESLLRQISELLGRASKDIGVRLPNL